MAKIKVKRCIRPQCMEIYHEGEKNRYCGCGSLLQVTEIEVKPKKNNYKKTTNPTEKKVSTVKNGENEEPIKQEVPALSETDGKESRAFLYLLLDNDEVEYELGSVTRIGRVTDSVQVDIDLTEYAGKNVSREHAVITKEKDSYYITNVSHNHSVRIVDQDENETVIEYGKKELLKTEDGILLSKKVLLQFIEEE